MPHRRILAHTIIYRGKTYRLSVADIWHDEKGWHVAITPFERETPGTIFRSGTIEILDATAAPPQILSKPI